MSRISKYFISLIFLFSIFIAGCGNRPVVEGFDADKESIVTYDKDGNIIDTRGHYLPKNGTWAGIVDLLHSNKKHNIAISIDHNNSKYSVKYKSGLCGGEWKIISSSPQTIKFQEKLTYGEQNCPDNGIVELIKIDENSSEYKFFGAQNSAIDNSTANLIYIDNIALKPKSVTKRIIKSETTLPDYSRDEDIVTDNITNLMWQDDKSVLNDDKDYVMYKYSNYDVDTQLCKNLRLGGYENWRLPTMMEFYTIVEIDRFKPVLDDMVFENIPYREVNGNPKEQYYRSSSSQTDVLAQTYGIGTTININNYGADKMRDVIVRCVRGESVQGVFERDIDSGIVSDYSTNLMWQDANLARSMTHERAIGYCEELILDRYDDWRIPNIQELDTIIGKDLVFASSSALYTWSSSTVADDDMKAFVLNDNLRSIKEKSSLLNISPRCVRGIPFSKE